MNKIKKTREHLIHLHPESTIRLFKFSLLYTAIASGALILSILFINYYFTYKSYSIYVFIGVGASIIFSSCITTVFGYKMHSKWERIWLIVLFVFIVIIEFTMLLSLRYPIAGVVGYTTMYVLVSVYWLTAMHFYGFIGKKYKGRFDYRKKKK